MIDRRGFFSMTLGAVVLGPVTKVTPVRFPPEEILEIDRQGVVHPSKPNFLLSYDIKTKTILELRVE